MIRCIVIDDTPLAVEKLEAFIAQVPLLHHQQSFNNGIEAIMYMKTNPVDLVFLDILFIEGQGAYLRIVTRQAKIMTIQSFQNMEQILPSDNFMRIHKSYIVAIDKIESIERNVILIAGQRISVGKSYQNEFYRRL